ncbi:MAG: hypothetical protein SF070_11185 [Gemmatimonadota bacterium]|nr:hypothetical protein [Gemmatimonadota bacterium]
MPHPLRTLCAVSRTLVPWQPGVLPSLGDAVVMDLRRAARHPAPVAESLRAALWCAVVVLVEEKIPPADLARALPHLPRGAAALVGSFEGETERLFQAIRSRPQPLGTDLLGYCATRGLPRELRAAIEDVLTLPDTDTDPATVAPPRSRSALDRRLAAFGPLRGREWDAFTRLLRVSESHAAGSVEQQAWLTDTDPRTLRRWSAELLRVDAHVILDTPGWEWKLEAMLRRFGYVTWPGASRRASGAVRQPALTGV